MFVVLVVDRVRVCFHANWRRTFNTEGGVFCSTCHVPSTQFLCYSASIFKVVVAIVIRFDVNIFTFIGRAKVKVRSAHKDSRVISAKQKKKTLVRNFAIGMYLKPFSWLLADGHVRGEFSTYLYGLGAISTTYNIQTYLTIWRNAACNAYYLRECVWFWNWYSIAGASAKDENGSSGDISHVSIYYDLMYASNPFTNRSCNSHYGQIHYSICVCVGGKRYVFERVESSNLCIMLWLAFVQHMKEKPMLCITDMFLINSSECKKTATRK